MGIAILLNCYSPIQLTLLSYTGVLKELSKFFPQAYFATEDFQPKGVSTPLIPLQTENGSYKLPPLDHNDSLQPIVLETFSLHLSIEHFQFAISPFKDWKQTQTLKGYMSFPLTASINHPMTSIQNPISDASTLANPKVSFNQPFAHYQHPPPPSHLKPLVSQPITSSNKTNHVSESEAPITNTSIPLNDSSFLFNSKDDYFYDEYYVNKTNVTTNATIDSQTTLQEQDESNTDNSEEPSSYSPRTRLKQKPVKGSRYPTSVITAPNTFNRRPLNETEDLIHMSLTNLLCSTRANPQPKDSAHVLQQTNLSTITSTAIHPVTTTQDIHLQREDTSASRRYFCLTTGY